MRCDESCRCDRLVHTKAVSLQDACADVLNSEIGAHRDVSGAGRTIRVVHQVIGESSVAVLTPMLDGVNEPTGDTQSAVDRMDGLDRSDSGEIAHSGLATNDVESQIEFDDIGTRMQTLELAIRCFRLGLFGYDPIRDVGWYSAEVGTMRDLDRQAWRGSLEGSEENVHPDDAVLIRNRLAALIERDEPYDIQIRLDQNGKGYRWVRSCAIAVRDEDGGAVRIVGALQDIDDEHRRAEALRISEARLQAMAEHAPVLIAIGNRHKGLHFANRAWRQLTGASLGDLAGDGWQSHIQAGDDTDTSHLFASCPQDSETRDLRLRICGPDGEWHLLLARRSILPSDHLPHQDIVVVATDVTSQMQSMDRLTLALDSAKAGMWDWRVDKAVFVSTPRLHTMLGEAPVHGVEPFQWFPDRIHPDDIDMAISRLEQSLHDDRIEYENVFRMRHTDGTYRWIRSQGRVVERDSTGQPTRMIGLHIDVTQKKEAELALHSALRDASDKRTRIRQILQHARSAIAIFDRDMRFVAVSDRWLSDYEIEDPDIIGKCVYDVMRVPERWRAVHARCLAGATESCDDDYYVKPNGQRKWERWEVCPWFDVATHEVAGLTIFSEDTTEMKLAEQVLASQIEAIAQASRLSMIDQLGIQLAHDLRHPLAEFVNRCYLVGESLNELLGADHSIATEVDALREIAMNVSDMVGNLGPTARRGQAKREVIPIGELIRSVIPLFGIRSRSAGIQFHIDNKAPSAVVSGDRLQLQQVLANVIVNAIESIENAKTGKGHIEICASPEDLSHVRIVVTDSGPGINIEDAGKAFGRFQSTKQSGMGIGLVISQEIIESHGGRIFFESLKPAKLNIVLPTSAGKQLHG